MRPFWLALMVVSWAYATERPAWSEGLPTVRPVVAAPIHVSRLRHGQADRVVLWLKRGRRWAARQEGADLVLDLPDMASLAAAGMPGEGPGLGFASQWVRGVTTAPGKARLALAPGALPRLRQLSDRLVIDVDDTAPPMQPGQFRPQNGLATSRFAGSQGPAPGSSAATGLARQAAPARLPSEYQPGDIPTLGLPIAQRPSASASSMQIPVSARSPLAMMPSLPAQPNRALRQEPVAPISETASMQVSRSLPAASAILLPPDAAAGGPSVLLQADRQSGAAVFDRAGELHVVFDTAHLLDLSQLKDDPVFGGTTERLLPDGMELQMHAVAGVQPRLTRRDDGWVLTLAASPMPVPASIGQVKDGVLTLTATAPGHVVVVEDEATGGRLLVGTQRERSERVASGHRSAEWTLLPSWRGVVVQPLSDRVELRGKETGFELRAADAPALASLWPAGLGAVGENGVAMTRRFDLPDLPMPVLRRRLAEALRDAALAPHTARTAPRIRVAESMLACGLDAEAAAVLLVAAADDPAARGDPSLQGLAAIASWLSQRAGGSKAAAAFPGFDPVTLGDSDEAMLWRSLWSGAGADPAGVAGILAARWRLLLEYPETLRRRMLPAVADVLSRGGQQAALSALLTAFPDPSLDLARAGQLQLQAKTDESLGALDRLAAGTDRLLRAQALEAAVEQRVATHRLTPAAAADQLDRQLYAWRGGDRELRLRLRAADLRAQGGDWRRALALLRETDGLFPDAHGRIHDVEIGVVSAMLRGDQAAQLGALDLMALADDASTLLGAEDADAALAPLLADRLLALDLPERAEPVIRRLLDRAGAGTVKIGLGLRLAGLMADRGDAAGALGVLDGSVRPGAGTGPAVAEGTGPGVKSRVIFRARLLTAMGRTAEALDQVSVLKGRSAVELQASIRESEKDWLGAAGALESLTDTAEFKAMPNGAKSEIVLHAARDASDAGDMAGLRRLRSAYASLFAHTADAELFAVLTSEPVQRVGDLPRSSQELVAMRSLSSTLSVASLRR